MSKHIHDLLRSSTALNNKIVIEVVEKSDKQLESGLWLSGSAVDTSMEDFRIGKVISSGFEPVKPDEHVIYLRFYGDKAGENLIVLDSKDVIAKF